jgi:hypothetical protein
MNPAEQRTHRTKVAQLEARIAVLETLVDDLARYLATWVPAIGATLAQLDARLDAQAPHARTDAPA